MKTKRALARIVPLMLCASLLGGCKRAPKEGNQSSQQGARGGNPAIVEVQPASDSAFTMSLNIDPAQPVFSRKTRFTVKVTDRSGAPVSGANARASLVMPLMDMGKNELDLKPTGDGTYQGTGQFTMAGEWEVVVTAAANGQKGKYTFNVKVGE
ncbi:MAG: FixH family protein [Acidobacteriaceae bacterium]|nr:FixH family protein [Acidobacteriaceae bacterium]